MSQLPSWDTPGQAAPERPRITSNLIEPDWQPRPARLAWSFWMTLIVGLIVIAYTALAGFTLTELTGTLAEAMPEELQADYDDEELERAVLVLMAAAHALTALTALAVVAAARSLTFARKPAARVMLVFTGVLLVVVGAITLVLRESTPAEFWVHAGAGVGLLVAIALTLTPAVSRWVHQDEVRRTIPLVSETSLDA